MLHDLFQFFYQRHWKTNLILSIASVVVSLCLVDVFEYNSELAQKLAHNFGRDFSLILAAGFLMY